VKYFRILHPLWTVINAGATWLKLRKHCSCRLLPHLC